MYKIWNETPLMWHTYGTHRSWYSKQRNALKSRINESTLCNRIHKHSFEGLGADTLTFCKSVPFAGEVGWGGLLASSNVELRLPIFFKVPPVCDVQNIIIFSYLPHWHLSEKVCQAKLLYF
jgi:hypothetical protein